MSAGGIEGKIREKIVDADLVDCMVALPAQLFYNTGIPACLMVCSHVIKPITILGTEVVKYYLLMPERWA